MKLFPRRLIRRFLYYRDGRGNNTAASHNAIPCDDVFLQENKILLPFVWKWGNSYPRSHYREVPHREPVPGRLEMLKSVRRTRNRRSVRITYGKLSARSDAGLNLTNSAWGLFSRLFYDSVEWNYFILIAIELSLYNVTYNSILHITIIIQYYNSIYILYWNQWTTTHTLCTHFGIYSHDTINRRNT